MRRLISITLIMMIPVLICANAIMGNQGERPLFANHIVKIQLSREADGTTNLSKEYRSEADSFGIDALDEFAASWGEHQIIRAHIRMADRAFEDEVGFDRWVILEYKERIDVLDAVKAFKDHKRWVDDACPEYYAYPAVVPNDPWNTSNWGHNNTGNNGPGSGTAGFDSKAHLAWDQSQGYGSSNIIIAIIDSGVDTSHPDLRLMAGYDYGDNDSNPMDDAGGGWNSPRGHGTACSGIAAGIANNGIGVSGIAGGCTVMPLKIATSSGDLPFTAINNALTHARNNGAHIISLSLGAALDQDNSGLSATNAALTAAYNAGITIFAATGNENASTISYPANHEKVIAVGAASPSGQRKSPSSSDGQTNWGSNYGVNTQNNRKAVDIMAATILPTTDIRGSDGYASGDYSTGFNGTSCATPYAAGVGALLKSRDPSLTPAEIRTILTSTATDMTYDGGVGWDRYTGYGLVNAYQAVLAAGGPECEITSPQDGDLFQQGTTVTINVNATDTGGSISNVKFYIDNQLRYTDSSSPYSWNWATSGVSLGNHTIKVVATNNQGKTAEESIVVTLLGAPDEGFESGNFSAFNWDNSSAIPWTVQSSEKFSGNYAAQAGAIGNNASTSLSITLDVTNAGNISFLSKVSSEANDYLRFYIDDVQRGQWSGNQPWAQQSYSVSTGLHTFTWTYVKNATTTGGSDTAWLDHIIFPAYNSYPAPRNLVGLAGNALVRLDWDSPAGANPTSYRVYRNGSLLTTIQDLFYNDTNVINGTTYSYYVKALYGSTESAASNTVYVTPEWMNTAIIGTGTDSTAGNEGCPINVFLKSLHGQSVYLASELIAAGVQGPLDITEIGFYVTDVPTVNMENYIIRMKHTDATDVSAWINGDDLETVYSSASYMPSGTGWNMFTFSTPFTWNGVDNIVVDTAFGVNTASNQTGRVQYSTVTDGYRYVRNASSNQTNVFSGGFKSNNRPNLKLTLAPTPEPEIQIDVTSLDYGSLTVGESLTQTFTISNTGTGNLTGNISTPMGYSVSPQQGRNTLSFTIGEGLSQTFDLKFNPNTPGTYNGNVVISHNADSDDKTIAVTGTALPLELDTPILQISRDGGNIRLSWDAVENANRYLIYATIDPTQWPASPTFETEQYFLELPLQSERIFYRIKASYIEP